MALYTLVTCCDMLPRTRGAIPHATYKFVVKYCLFMILFGITVLYVCYPWKGTLHPGTFVDIALSVVYESAW